MSNDNRDYPAWLDEELFAGLTEEEPSAAPQSAPEEKASGTEKAAPKKKAKPSKDKDGAKKPKAKKSAPEPGDEPKPKKKKAAAKEAPDADKNMPAEPEKAEAPEQSEASEKPEKDEKAEKGKKPGKAEKKAPADKAGDRKKPRKSAEELAAEEAERERARKEKQSKARGAARKWLIAMIVLVSLALIVCVGATVGAYLVTNSDTNLPNVYLGGVYVGGMTKEQTIAALDEAGWDAKRGGTLTVRLPEGVSFELDFLTAGAYEPKEDAAEAAFAYGHTDDWFGNLFTYINDLLSPQELGRTEFTIDRAYVSAAVDKAVDEFETVTAGEEYNVNEETSTLECVKGAGQVSLDRQAICDKACALLLSGVHELEWKEIVGEMRMPDFAALAAKLKSEPVNAYYDPEKDEIVPEVMGVELDASKAEELWKKAGVLEKFSVPITLIEPEITAESLKNVLFHDKLGDCMTYLWGSTANRISNVRVACSRFDGMVLQPGERFSYNDVVGERTAEAGFKLAPTYSGTAHIDALGGGICQVSSTLYNAALYAGLEINERVCHTMIVGYLPLGLDATVDWPDTNFVFTNNRDYPIRIKAGVNDRGSELLIEIWGTDVDGSYVDMLHYEWPAYDENYRANYGIDVQVGYGARSIRRTYHADGSYTDEDNVYSYYHIPEEEIHWPVIETESDDGAGGGEEG